MSTYVGTAVSTKDGTDYYSPTPHLCQRCGEWKCWFRNENGQTIGCIDCAAKPKETA